MSALNDQRSSPVIGVVMLSDGSEIPEASLASIIDSTTTAGYTYFCDAAPGSLSSAAVWRISRMSSAGVTQWADGNANFDNIADNRASLTYA